MARSLDSHSIWAKPPQPVPAWACKDPAQEGSQFSKASPGSLNSRSNNLINRAAAVVQKRTPPSTFLRSTSHTSHATPPTFATLSEEESMENCDNVNLSEEPHDSLEDERQKDCDRLHNGEQTSSPKPPGSVDLMANVSLISTTRTNGAEYCEDKTSNSKVLQEFEDDDEEEIGDISSSSEIEIDADPMAEVTTPQIEEMQEKINSVFMRGAKQSLVSNSNGDSQLEVSNSCLVPQGGEEEDDDEGDKTLRESFSNNSKNDKSISIVTAIRRAQDIDEDSNYIHDEYSHDLKKDDHEKDTLNTNNGKQVLIYDNETDDDPDDGFSPSNHGEDGPETDADDEIDGEGMKGSNRTPDSLLSPISDDAPPAKGWV